MYICQVKSFQNAKEELQSEVQELKDKLEKQQRFIAREVFLAHSCVYSMEAHTFSVVAIIYYTLHRRMVRGRCKGLPSPVLCLKLTTENIFSSVYIIFAPFSYCTVHL